MRRNAFRLTLVTVVMLGGRFASADPINFTTGNAEVDMPSSNKYVNVTNVDGNPLNTIFQMPEMTSNGNNLINGYAIKDVRTYYDFNTDKLYVGINAYSIAGTAVGADGAQGAAMDQVLASHGGSDPANLGGDKSITLAFIGTSPNDLNQPGQTVMVAGVPADKSAANPNGTDGFTIAAAKGNSNLIQYNYGSILTNNQGNLAFNPSSAHPDFEFSISNFSKISPSLDPTKGFFIQVYAGSAQDGPIGEEATGTFRIPAFQPQNTVPEPTTWLAWTVVVGGSLHQLRRRGKK